MFSMAKAVNILNSIEDIDDLTLFKVIEELVNPESRSAFILMTPDKRRGWMDWVSEAFISVGTGYNLFSATALESKSGDMAGSLSFLMICPVGYAIARGAIAVISAID
nr:hypothetical protein CFP56_25520 [Quercus suber]